MLLKGTRNLWEDETSICPMGGGFYFVSGLYVLTMNFHAVLSDDSGVGLKSIHRASDSKPGLSSPHVSQHGLHLPLLELSIFPSQMKISLNLTW